MAFGSVKARGAYRMWKEKRLTKEAQIFYEQGEYRSAALKAQRVLMMNPSNLEASRIMAEVLEAARVRESILWRRRLTELTPDDPQQRYAWASSALSFGEASMAVQALGSFPKAARETAAYHSLAGSIAMVQGKVELAEQHYAEALRLEPDKKQRQLDLANVELQDADPKIRQRAEATLSRFLADKEKRVDALRMLTVDAARTARMEKALDLATKLQEDPNAKFSDHLIHLNLLHAASNKRFATKLQELQGRAKEKPEELFDLLSWMNGNRTALLALNWAKSLPEKITSEPPAPLAIGESYTILSDWDGLKRYTEHGSWGVIDFGRCALLALAHRKQGEEFKSKSQWINATRSAQKRPDALIALARLASAWSWETEAEELLWDIANGNFPPEWVLTALHKIYAQRRDSHGLYRLLKRELALNPKDPHATNQVIYASLLLSDNTERANDKAAALYKNHPDDITIATTYALALHFQRKNEEALQVMERFKDSDLRNPDVAVYYALLLTATGQNEKAREYFKLGENSPLLPEEQKMVNQAQALLNAP
jgi:predicted Zn-dependent protease